MKVKKHIPIREAQHPYHVGRKARADIVAQLALQFGQCRVVVDEYYLFEVHVWGVGVLAGKP